MSYPESALLQSPIAARAARMSGFVALLLIAQAGAIHAWADNPPTVVNVDANASRRPINPNIYGQNWATPSEISALNAPVDRFGGNANSRYNWQIDAHSAGADWYFETYSDGDGSGTPGGSVDKSITDTRSAGNGVEPMITIPMLDYLAKLGPNRSTLAGFSVKKYGAQQKTDPYNSDAGNGVSKSTGLNITGNDPLDTGVANSPDIQKAWVQHLVSKFGNAAAPTGVKYYILDNEPSIWTGTHRDVHPNRPGYDEMYNKIVSYASAIRSVDSSAQIIGPEEWDWWAMYASGIDQGGGNDYASHGNVRYYPWLLQKLYSYKQQTGVQLVDIVSVHGYTDMDFSNTGGDDTLAAQQIRNRHTRILWDPNYKTPFWWKDLGINGGVINWIPTLRGWVDTYYPGLKIAFTEYSWGNETNLNGATTQADVLGIYGREGLDMANRWGTGKDSNGNVTVTFLASKIYRNYDGNNSTFGDTSVSATIANPDNLSAFAAVRGADGALTVMVINKQQGSTPVTVNLAGFTAKATAQSWQINSTAQTSITRLADVSVNNNALTATVPSQSITLFVLPATQTNPPGFGGAATADFDHDGQSDLIWQNTGTGERSIWLMKGTTLTAGVSLGPSPTQWSIAAVADFNGDGKVDLVWQNTLTGERTIWLMNGTTFSGSVSIGTYSTDLMIAGAGDFNGDGKPDLVWQNTSTGERSIWLMNGTTLGSVVDLGTLPPEWSIAGTGEFNGDRKCDLIWQNTVTGERAIWLMNGTTVTAGVALGVYPQLQISGTGDYNGDGKSDILWTNVNTGERLIWLMNGTTKASEVSLGVVSLDWVLNRPVFRRALADFNNDGKSDLVWQNTATGDRAIWIMNGIEARTGLSLGNYPVDQWIAAIGDFNNDGKADLVWENRTTGARSITLLNGTTVLSTVALGTYGTEWRINTTGDFNGDGKPDLVWTNGTTGARAIWLMDGTAFTGGADLGTVAVAQQVAGTGDFNGDGQADILWQNTTTGARTIWLMNGTVHTSTVTLGTYGPEWSIVGTGDYNADGKPDLLWQNTLTGERAVWLMNGTTFISSAAVGSYDINWSIRN